MPRGEVSGYEFGVTCPFCGYRMSDQEVDGSIKDGEEIDCGAEWNDHGCGETFKLEFTEGGGVPDGAVEEATRLVEERFDDDVEAWLVGSRVRGEGTADSDLDVFVESDQQGNELVEDTKCGVVIDIIANPHGPAFVGDGVEIKLPIGRNRNHD
jgi:hypothetical protein